MPDGNDIRLPADYIEFLAKGSSLSYDTSRCECGQVRLRPLDRLTVSSVGVNTRDTPQHQFDPNRNQSGAYLVPAVDLVAEVTGDHDPTFILCWLPDLAQFGSYDTDHGKLLVFPNSQWSDIVADSFFYVQSQWNGACSPRSEYMTPWPRFRFAPRERR